MEAIIPESVQLPRPSSDILQKRSRRARAACELCRTKKVRCDARAGRACTNCTFDNVPCALAPRRLRSAREGPNIPPLAPRLFLQGPLPEQTNTSRTMVIPPQSGEAASGHSQSLSVVSSTSEPTDNLSMSDPRIWTSSGLEHSLSPSEESFRISHSPSSRHSTRLSSSVGNLPDYIKPFPASIEPEDIEHLEKKGVFMLPDPDLRVACLTCYFQHVQPMYPIVDPTKITLLLKGTNPGNEKMSLLLLYALVFVGGTWIDIRLMRKIGFLSRKAFRKSIHRKMRLLYDADYENDRICLIQVCILWTFWFEGPNENKDGWHWIGVALSLSRVVGLHRASSDANTNSNVYRHYRRLWWSLVTRDVICSFSLSRSPRTADIDSNVTMLEIADFDSLETPGAVHQEANPQTLRQQRTFAQICVRYVKLVSIFGRICKAAYPESDAGRTSVLYSSQQFEGTDSINSNRNLTIKDQLRIFQKHLDDWRQDVPDDLWHPLDLSSSPNGPDIPELVHRGLLSMMYYATVMILHRPQMLSGIIGARQHDTSPETAPDSSKRLVRFAACQISQIAFDFYQDDLVSSLAATCITCLILASINHIFDMMSNEQVIRSEARQRLEQSKAIFHAFSERQVGGQWALEVIHYILHRLKHQPRDNRVDVQISKQDVSTTVVNQDYVPLTGGEVDRLCQSQASHSVASIDRPAQLRTMAVVNDSGPPPPGTSSVPSFSMPRVQFGSTDAMLSSLALDQPVPDNPTDFLGPDLAWLDFSNISENLDDMSWTESIHI